MKVERSEVNNNHGSRIFIYLVSKIYRYTSPPQKEALHSDMSPSFVEPGLELNHLVQSRWTLYQNVMALKTRHSLMVTNAVA